MASGQTINGIIVKNNREVIIAPASVNKMISAFTQTISIARYYKYVEAVVSQFDSRGDWNCSAMQSFKRSELQEIDHVAMATNAGHQHGVGVVPALPHTSVFKCGPNGKVAAPGAPIG